MKVRLNIGGAWATIFPEKVELADNEPLIIENRCGEKAHLQYGTKTYYSENGQWVIPYGDIDNNKSMLVKGKAKLLYVRSFTVTKHELDKEINRKDKQLEVEIALLQNEVRELKEFKQNATKDIEALCEAYNELAKDFNAIKEEMAL